METSSVFDIIRISNDNHTCLNVSIETDNFHRRKGHMYIYLRFMVVYPILNIILHSFALLVFHRMRSRTVLIKLLMALSVAELVFQIFTACTHLLIYLMETSRLSASSVATAKILACLMPTSMVLVTSGHIARNWTILLIAAMRFEFVCRQSWKRLLFRNHAIAGKMAFIWLLAVATSSPRLFELRFWVCETSATVAYMTNNLLSHEGYMIGFGCLLALIQSIGPVTTVCALSSCLLRALCRQRVIRRNLRCTSNTPTANTAATMHHTDNISSRSTDLLVVLLCCAFALCELPSFLKVADTMELRLHELGVFMNLMTCVDSTLGFFVYLVTNPEFRTTLLRTCCCRMVARWMNLAHHHLTWTERQSTFERSRQMVTAEPMATNPTMDRMTDAPLVEMPILGSEGKCVDQELSYLEAEWPMLEDGEDGPAMVDKDSSV